METRRGFQIKTRILFSVIAIILGLSLILFHSGRGVQFNWGTHVIFAPISFVLIILGIASILKAIKGPKI